MYTEEEARKRWCPEARTMQWELPDRERPVAASINRDVGWNVDAAQERADIKPRHCCIASDCMAWRWQNEPGGYVGYDDAKGRSAYKATGYCGLSGKPHGDS